MANNSTTVLSHIKNANFYILFQATQFEKSWMNIFSGSFPQDNNQFI